VRAPESLTSLYDYGVLDEVIRPLMSGKEAHVFLVVSGGRYAVAKIYKEAQNRSFKHRAEYTEGRKTRNSRDQRAIANRSRHGRQQDEAAWRSTEVDMIHRLHAAGVRVPVPYHFIDGVLLMELVTDADGDPAPRLGDLPFDPASARVMYDRLIRAVIQMLCAGVVHGDLSEFNVLAAADGPVIIDFPQSIDSAHNTNARKLLLRDVDNLHRFLLRHVPHARRLPLAEEIWSLYEQNLLSPDTRLRGDYRAPVRQANTASVLDVIHDANRDERKRRDALGLRGGPTKKEAPPVYQGLANEGLKFFRHLRDPQPRNAPRNGQQPQGQRPQGQRPQQGQQPQGQRPQQGQQPQGQRPQGQHSQGQRPQGQRPQGQHSQGQRPQGQHPQGQRPQGQHPPNHSRRRRGRGPSSPNAPQPARDKPPTEPGTTKGE
jgi:RIO kinase 1